MWNFFSALSRQDTQKDPADGKAKEDIHSLNAMTLNGRIVIEYRRSEVSDVFLFSFPQECRNEMLKSLAILPKGELADTGFRPEDAAIIAQEIHDLTSINGK